MHLFFMIQSVHLYFFFFFFNDTATTEIYTLSLHDALPISVDDAVRRVRELALELRPSLLDDLGLASALRSEEHTSELQSRRDLVCRLLLEKKKKNRRATSNNLISKTT